MLSLSIEISDSAKDGANVRISDVILSLEEFVKLLREGCFGTKVTVEFTLTKKDRARTGSGSTARPCSAI